MLAEIPIARLFFGQEAPHYRRFAIGLHLRSLVHGSPENTTPRDRIALIAGYQKPKADATEKETAMRVALFRED